MNHWRLDTISSGRSPFSKNLTACVIGRGSPTRSPDSLEELDDPGPRLRGRQVRELIVGLLRARRIDRLPALAAERHRPQRAVRLDDRPYRQRERAPPHDVGQIAERADHGDAGPLRGVGELVRLHRHADTEHRRLDVRPEERLVALVVGVRDERHARRNELGTRRLDVDERSVRLSEMDPVIRARLLSILELGLRDGRAEVHVPERWSVDLVGVPARQEPEKGNLRDALGAPPDRRVGHGPVDRQAQMLPERLERLFVLGRQPRAELDEVRTGDRDRLLARLLGRLIGRVIGQRGIAADAKVVLHAAFGRQAVVVPSHGIEHGAPAHALEARDDVGVGIREDVADMEGAADRRRRRVDRVHLGAGPRAIESEDGAAVPRGRPLRLEALQRGLLGHPHGMVQIQTTHPITRSPNPALPHTSTSRRLLDALDLFPDEPFGDVEDAGAGFIAEAREHARADHLDDVVGHSRL